MLLIKRVTDSVHGHVVGSARFKASIFVTGFAKTFSGSIGSGQRAASAVIYDQPDRGIRVAAHAAGKRADVLSK